MSGIDRGVSARPDFDRSITGVSHANEPLAALPKRARLQPVGDSGVGSHTEVLLKPLSTHERLLRRYLHPPVASAAVVAPTRYRQLLADVARRLRRRSGNESATVERAADVLEDVQDQMHYLDVQLKRLLGA